MLEIKTIKDAKALVGQTFGKGNNSRVITRIEGLTKSPWGAYLLGSVYWKRTGGKERGVPQDLQSFIAWARKATLDRVSVGSIEDIEAFLSEIPKGTPVDGFIIRDGNKIQVSFEIEE